MSDPQAEPPDDKVLLERWRAGDQKAAQLLFDRYVDRMLTLARRRISQRLASRVDPEDVVQSVFRTFFGRAREGEFHIEGDEDLTKLLVKITVHKVLRQVAYHRAAKRDPNQETGQAEDSQEWLMDILDRDPSPEVQGAFLDQMEHLLNRMRPEDRVILELRLQGYSNLEIASKLGISDRKIRRVIERVRGLAQQEGLFS